VQRSYRRTDYLDQRAALMERWANFVASQSNSVELKNEEN
jgi:hypothetical protein